MWIECIHRSSPWIGGNRVRLLNEEKEVSGWFHTDWPKLWAFHLHYLDAARSEWIEKWLADNPQAVGIGWHAYPTSRRIVNLIKYVLSGGILTPIQLNSLATQTEHLYNSIENRVLANHLIANAKALIFAGSFFNGNVAERWLGRGMQILLEQLNEQILEDGGHFERSPMYHCQVLEDLLDLENISGVYEAAHLNLEDRIGLMVGWLQAMLHPDGQIPFFNDSTFGMAAAPHELFDYTKRLGLTARSSGLGSSQYVRLENEAATVLFDAGDIGPDYQPGHAHADTLSFEISTRRGRVLVNSGTSTYERGPQRDWERGTSAHNTVRVDGVDQSEVWHRFRVARRARTRDIRTDHKSFVEATHDGYMRLSPPVLHRRALRLFDDRLEVMDELDGKGTHQIQVYFHVHPNATVEISLDPRLSRRDVMTTYHPGINISIPKSTVVGQYTGRLPITLTSTVSL